MNITHILSQNKRTLSFEIFPPTTKNNLDSVLNTTKNIATLQPAYMSLAYKGGPQQEYTKCIATMQNTCKTTALAHLTCVHTTKKNIPKQLDTIKRLGVNNILAVRGDIPHNSCIKDKTHTYASELVRDILLYDNNLCVGGACHPEGHPEAQSLQHDIHNLKIKVQAGCSFLMTQIFFHNKTLYSYLDKLNKANITIPVVAGIMPLTDAKYLNICTQSGIHLPPKLKNIINQFAHKPKAMMQAGTAFAIEQLLDLYNQGIKAVHIYSMNRFQVAKKLKDSVQNLLT